MRDHSVEDLTVLRRLIDQVPAMVAYWDAECCNVVANAAYGEWFGFDPDQMRGVHISDVIGAEVYALNLPYIEGVLQGTGQTFDRTLTDQRGLVRHTETSYVPEVVNDRVVGFSVLVTEVTARVEAERATTRAIDQYRSLVQNLPDAFVALFDPELHFLIAEGGGLKNFGLSTDQIEGHTLLDVLPEHNADVEQYFRRALEGDTSHWTRMVNGHSFVMIAAPVRRGTETPFAGMVLGRDVTEQRRLEVASTALHHLALAAARRAPLEEIVELVSRSTLELFAADYAGVTRFDTDGMRLLYLAPLGDRRGELLQDVDNTAAALVARLGTAQIVEHETGANTTGTLSDLVLGSSAAAPIKIGPRIWGSIGVGVHHHFSDPQAILEVLQNFADLVSLAISNNEAWEELELQAHRDPLTSLPNRRVFEEQLDNEHKRAVRANVPVAVAIIDLDHFKMVNDTYGHQVGDEVLVEVASRLRASSRSDELVARLGGEEFAVILFDCPSSELRMACERFRRSISDASFVHDIELTASVGAATRAENTNPTTLIRLADRALYGAKDAGRNQVVVDS